MVAKQKGSSLCEMMIIHNASDAAVDDDDDDVSHDDDEYEVLMCGTAFENRCRKVMVVLMTETRAKR